MRKSLVCFLFAGLSLYAAPISYQVNVNTSSLSGTSGFVDFQYNPGFTTVDPSFVTIDMFTPAGQLVGPPQVNGDVIGVLPGSVKISNTGLFNDYFEGFTFANALSFRVTFDGPPPSGTATGSSTFAFTMFAADGATPLLGGGPNGEYAIGTVSPRGAITFTTPEPGTLGLIGIGFLVLGFKTRRK